MSNLVSPLKSTGVIVHDSPVFYPTVTCNSWLLSQITLTFQLYSGIQCPLSQSIQFPFEFSLIFQVSSCTWKHNYRSKMGFVLTITYYNVSFRCSFSGNMQSCFTVLINVYLISDNYRPFIVFMSLRDDAPVDHSAKYCH